jgi:hypothetical protein
VTSPRSSRIADIAALLITLAAFFSTLWVTDHIFERLPHLEDEMAYVWEAKAIAGGQIRLPAPDCSRCFLMPFVIDYNGYRFGKYPIGWPVVLSLGIQLGIRQLVNPLLGAAAVWLTYRLGKKIFSPGVGLLAAALTVTSPFFLMNTGSLLSHTWGFFLTAAFALAWVDIFFPHFRSRSVPVALPAVIAALCLGLLALSRPMTAAAVGLPFFVHGLYLMFKGAKNQRILLVAIGLGAGLVAGLHFVWQYAVTGDALLNPYTLWWSYDKIGFGPGTGLQPGGYNLASAWANTRFSVSVLDTDLFGWPFLSLVFLPFGIWAIRRSLPGWLLFALIPSIIIAYGLYWITSWLFGPRYFFEAMPGLTLISAAGITWCTGPLRLRSTDPAGTDKIPAVRSLARPAIVTLIVSLLVSANLWLYLPLRLGQFRGLYGVAAVHTQPFLTPEFKAVTPALIIVHKQISWYEYGTLIDLETPFLDTPYVFVYDPTPEEEARITAQFPGRAVYHYYHSDPYHLYSSRLP